MRALRVGALAVGLVAAACSNGSDTASTSAPVTVTPSTGSTQAAVMQLRPVRDVAQPNAATYTDLHVSCGNGAPSPCTEDELVNAPSLVLQDAEGVRYALDAAIANGDDVVAATAVKVPGEWVVNFELGPDATARFAAITTALAPLPQNDPAKRIAVVVDGEPVSVPAVQSPITSGSGQIAGGYTQGAAQALADALGGTPS